MSSYSVPTSLHVAVRSEMSKSLRNHSTSVTMMLHAWSLTSVPVCSKYIVLLKAGGRYRSTRLDVPSRWLQSYCHNAMVLFLFSIYWSSSGQNVWWFIFNESKHRDEREMVDIKIEKWRTIVTLSSPCIGPVSSRVLGSDSASIGAHCSNANLSSSPRWTDR